MKYFLTLLFTSVTLVTFSQTINYSNLTGTWYCYNATQQEAFDHNTQQHTVGYTGSYASFYSDSTFAEEGLYLRYMTTTGKYRVNKKTKKISYYELVDRTRDEKTIAEMENYMHHERPEQKILSLGRDTLIILEPPADTIYYKRIK